jgi:hypothetical protein
MQGYIATVIHWNGFAITGLISGVDPSGLYIQRPDEAPIFCDFANIQTIAFRK